MERIDGVCTAWQGCDKPGKPIIDPYAQDVLNETVPVVLCDEHEQQLVAEI